MIMQGGFVAACAEDITVYVCTYCLLSLIIMLRMGFIAHWEISHDTPTRILGFRANNNTVCPISPPLV